MYHQNKTFTQLNHTFNSIFLHLHFCCYYFYCMRAVLKPIAKMRESYQQTLQGKPQAHPKQLNLTLLSNPILKTEDKYRATIHEVTLYNKRVAQGEVTDEYEVMCFQRLAVLMAELGNMVSKADQLARLAQVTKWWNEQRRIIKQRKDLGVVKYKTDKKIDRLRQYRGRMARSTIVEESALLPNQLRFVEVFPFEMDYRTTHREMDVPQKRLSEYKRKIINISDAHLMEEPQSRHGEKVNYPKPRKIKPHEEIHETINQETQQNAQEQPEQIEAQPSNNNPQNVSQNPDPNPQTVPPEETKQEDPNQDFGMGAEEPGEAEEEGEEQPVNDKLAPKNKIYTWSIRQREEEEKAMTYTKPYLFYRGHDIEAQREMQLRTVRQQQRSLQIQREEKELIQRAHDWATHKSRVDREIMQKLESMSANRSFAFSYEEPQKKETLTPSDQRKYGFSVPVKAPPTGMQVNLQRGLPEIGRSEPIERQIRKDRLKTLKNKFSTILGLRESEDLREKSNAESMCLCFSPQRRNFSMILEEHSPQREKEIQLQEIQKIKQSLGKYRINIGIRTLAQALVPDSPSDIPTQFSSPPKLLSSNPFFVQPKKKKKKKK